MSKTIGHIHARQAAAVTVLLTCRNSTTEQTAMWPVSGLFTICVLDLRFALCHLTISV